MIDEKRRERILANPEIAVTLARMQMETRDLVIAGLETMPRDMLLDTARSLVRTFAMSSEALAVIGEELIRLRSAS